MSDRWALNQCRVLVVSVEVWFFWAFFHKAGRWILILFEYNAGLLFLRRVHGSSNAENLAPEFIVIDVPGCIFGFGRCLYLAGFSFHILFSIFFRPIVAVHSFCQRDAFFV